MQVNPILNTFNPFQSFRFKQMSKPSYSVPSYSVPSYSKPSYSVPRVPPGLTANDISDAIAGAYGTAVHVRLVPANPMFRYGGVQHAAIITMAQEGNTNRNDNHNHDHNHDFKVVYDFNHDFKVVYDFNHDHNHDFKVVYDLEAQLHFTMHKIDGPQQDLDKQRMWRWALRGIVIQ
jgi:hypothetical protein